MSINGINSVISSNNNTTNQRTKNTNTPKSTESTSGSSSTAAAIYEPSSKSVTETPPKTYTRDTATVDRMKEQLLSDQSHLQGLVEKLMLKQGQKMTDLSDMYEALKSGTLEVDPVTAAQAKADIAEDGYWGVEQTSDRLVSMAMALSGGDPSKADTMIEAIKKGFDQATSAWGSDLPDICKNTMDCATDKLTKWKESLQSE